jgi:hypothetical protein
MAITRFLNFRVVLLRPDTGAPAGTVAPPTGGDLSVLMVEERAAEGMVSPAFRLAANASTVFLGERLTGLGVAVPADAGAVSWGAALSPDDAAALAALLAEVAAAPDIPEPPPGCDGTWYTLTVASASGTRGFRWWPNLPEPGGPAERLVAAMRGLAENALISGAELIFHSPPTPTPAEPTPLPWWRRLLGV